MLLCLLMQSASVHANFFVTCSSCLTAAGCGSVIIENNAVLQGRTSRWAIAWSFAADPRTADVPMPRYAPADAASAGLQPA